MNQGLENSQQKIILKVEYQDAKFKQVVQNPMQINFEQLRVSITENLKSIIGDNNIEASQFKLTDESGFQYNLKDFVSDLVQNNDLIKIIKNDKIQPQQQQEMQLNQQQRYQKQIYNAPIEEIKQELPNKNYSTKSEPKEAIVVLMDCSGSMSKSYFNDQSLSRKGAVNAFFSAFADKTIAFEFNHVVQLICFSSTLDRKCDFIQDFNKFIKLVDDANPGGNTKLYDAMKQACDNLLSYKNNHQNILLRIIALTDGEDNASQVQQKDLVKIIIQNQITIDSFVVGANCQGLKTITHASGGRCYQPQTLVQGLKLFEIETILSVGVREKKQQQLDENIDLDSLNARPFDTDGIQMDIPEQVNLPSISAQQMVEQIQSNQANQSLGVNQGPSKRLMKELQNIITYPPENCQIKPSKDDVLFWNATLIGPKDTPYENGIFQLYIKFTKDYPMIPPKVNFITKIYHCNISSNGSICLDILKDKWSPALQVKIIFNSILLLLKYPNPDDPLDSEVATIFKQNQELYKQNAREYTKKYAI